MYLRKIALKRLTYPGSHFGQNMGTKRVTSNYTCRRTWKRSSTL